MIVKESKSRNCMISISSKNAAKYFINEDNKIFFRIGNNIYSLTDTSVNTFAKQHRLFKKVVSPIILTSVNFQLRSHEVTNSDSKRTFKRNIKHPISKPLSSMNHGQLFVDKATNINKLYFKVDSIICYLDKDKCKVSNINENSNEYFYLPVITSIKYKLID